MSPREPDTDPYRLVRNIKLKNLAIFKRKIKIHIINSLVSKKSVWLKID